MVCKSARQRSLLSDQLSYTVIRQSLIQEWTYELLNSWREPKNHYHYKHYDKPDDPTQYCRKIHSIPHKVPPVFATMRKL
jgi:hypothetical protein